MTRSAAPTSAAAGLDDIIANRAWLYRSDPFGHVVARNVFTRAFYDSLAAQLSTLLNRGLSDSPDGSRFSRAMPGYDAYGISITPHLGEPVTTFISPAWRDLMCGLFTIEATPYVFAGAHHHAPHGSDGFIHNDFNPVWFPRAGAGEIQIPDPRRCDFKTGAGSLAPAEKVETIRGAVVLFYLLNDGWQAGDGGETGLFASRDAAGAPAARCLPENNSLVAFECTPHSFHAYLSNHRRARTSIIMWVHRGLDEAVERHGGEQIERWKT